MASILAILSAAAYGAADFLGGMAARRATTVAAVIVSQAAGLLLLGLGLPLLPDAVVQPRDIAWGGVAGLTGGGGGALLYRGRGMGLMGSGGAPTAWCCGGGS